MAKINLYLNGASYSIDKANLAPATEELKAHLSSKLNGTGATINFGGTVYNIDSAKLSSAKEIFIAHLNTIAGSGDTKVSIGGIEYSLDATKLAGALSELGTAFTTLETATALSAPSIALNEDVLNIFDATGLATSFDILVDGKLAGRIELVSEDEPEEDELAGTWVFNDIITAPTELPGGKLEVAILFNSNNVQFIGMIFKYNDFGDEQLLHFDFLTDNTRDLMAVETEMWSNEMAWVQPEFQTITITSKLSEVTNGEALLAWLKVNATKQEAASLISFTIDGTSYQAEEGMTWYEWCNSAYNTAGYTCGGEDSYSYVYTAGAGNYMVIRADGTYIKGNNSIEASHAYKHIYAGSVD